MRKRSSRHRQKPDPEAKRVGARVRMLRQEFEFTFDAFVEELGMGRGYLSELERGLVVPSLTALSRVATALGLTIGDLVLKDSVREQLFEQTRGMSDAEVRRLMAEVRHLQPALKKVAGAPSERYLTALPLFRIRPAAGPYSELQEGGIEAWIRPAADVPVKRGLFLAYVSGRSMEPAIPDGAVCLFQRPWPLPQLGQVGIFVLTTAGDPYDMGRYTIKEYRPVTVEREEGLRVEGNLRPRNRAFAPVRATPLDEDNERPFARFLRVVSG